ncbi:MAG: transferrin-binding protein-like solute binding protein [Caulobacteraceae bacterium]
MGSNTTTETAAAGGPTFDGSSGTFPAVGAAFAILQSSITISSTAIAADTTTNADGATLTYQGQDGSNHSEFDISIPGLGISNQPVAYQGSGGLTGTTKYEGAMSGGGDMLVDLDTFPYMAVGMWSVLPTGNALDASNNAFGIGGYATPTASMPTTGTATYGGPVIGLAAVPQGANHISAGLYGAASLNVNFASGAVTGQMTDMRAYPLAGGPTEAWDNVDFTATISGAGLSGTTSVKSVPASGTYRIAAIGSGHIVGSFYGPAGQDIGAVWNLYDGTNGSYGVIGATTPATTVPSAYTVTAPDAPTVGSAAPTTAAAGLEMASVGGPNFSASPSAPAAGTVFAATETAMQISPTYAVADDATTAGGLTETVSNYSTGTYELKIPNLGIDATITTGTFGIQLSDGDFISLSDLSPGGTPGMLNYVALRQWTLKDSNDSATLGTGFALIGYQTPTSSMPTTGSATYSGVGNVTGSDFWPAGAILSLTGDGSLTANFATGAVSGSMTGIKVAQNPWNNVTITGSISGDTFSGATSSGPTGGTGYEMNNGTGSISGGFYGPNANEVGAVWTLSDGFSSAIGVFGAPQPAAATTIGSFSAGTIGSAPPTTPANGFQQATNGYEISGGTTPLGTVFALTQSAVLITPTPAGTTLATTIGADTTTNGQGATITTATTNASLDSVELKIPSLGIDATLDPTVGVAAQAANGHWASINGLGVDYYTAFGQWAVSVTKGSEPTNTGWFTMGYQTPTSGMPASGSADFATTAEGSVYGPSSAAGAFPPYSVSNLRGGSGTLTANFSTGVMTGTISGLEVTSSGAVWGGFSVNATISGAAFSGSTAAVTGSGSGGVFMSASATGTVNGSFNGPTANEVGAVWTLSDGTRSASGVLFGAKQAPSDRRLKRDVEPMTRLAGGLRLYRYRYLGGERTFVGVMAQDLLADARYADAVSRTDDGFLMVDYARLGLPVSDAELEAMRRDGAAAKRVLEASDSVVVA